MRFIGADLHKKSITFCVVELVNNKTKIVERRRVQCCQAERICNLLDAHAPCDLVVEASIGYEWFAELAQKHTQRVAIAHAGKMKIIAESTRKTDKIDAFVLAEFLAKDMIPESWRPTPRVRQHRSLVRRRFKIQSSITRTKNTLRGILTKYRADRTDLFAQAGWDAVNKSEFLEQEHWIMDELWEELAQHQQRLQKIDARLETFAQTATQPEQEARATLATIPQVGSVTIDVILAELGDWTRFKNGESVVAFAGLAPGVRSSDEKRHDLKITKAGSPLLRWIMIQLAQRLKKKSSRWNYIFERLHRQAGNKKATVAIARRLLLVIFAMLRDGTAYRHPAQPA